MNGDLDLLSAKAAKAIEAEQRGSKIIVWSITAWEVAMLVSRGRLSLALDIAAWLACIEEIEAVSFAPVDNEIGVKAVELPDEFHKDLADRIIVATARKLGAPVITADDKIRGYRHVRTIW